MKNLSVFILICLLTGCATTQTTQSNKTPHDRVLALVDAAQAALIEKDPIGAIQFLKTAKEIEPKFGPIYHVEALAFHMRKDYSAALKSMQTSVSYDPTNSYSNNTYGKMLLDVGRVEEAEKYLTKAAQDPTFRESFKAKTTLGIIRYRANELDRADAFFEKAINDDPVNACIAYYYRGHVALKKSKLNSAISYYDQASKKFCSGFTDAHFALGLAYERNHQQDAARKKYLEIKQNFPESASSDQAMERLKRLQ